MLESLKELKARACQNLEGDIPNEIGGLSFLRILDLRRSMIRRLPMTMNQLSHLQELYLDFCDEFEQIPMLPMSLKVLRFSSYLLWNAPDLSYLTSLVNLYIYNYASQLSEFRHGAPKIKWIEGLFNLESLTLIARDVTFPLINLATLSRLRILAITCVDSRSLGGLPSSLEELSLYDVKSPMERSLFSNLTNLSQLALYKCWLREVDFDDVLGQQLVKLHRLEVMDNELLERLSVSRLTGLQELEVFNCSSLMKIQGVEKLGSLETLNIQACSCLERLPDLSELKKLETVILVHCPLQNLPDLRFQDTCHLTVLECRGSPDFAGTYGSWKDHSGDDVNGQL